MQKKYDVFLICPVRNANEEQKEKMKEYINNLESLNKKVYYPARDTNQEDTTGLKICKDNCKAIKQSKEIHIFWDSTSQFTYFDLGMVFMANKELTIVNTDDLIITGHKSADDMINDWYKNGRS